MTTQIINCVPEILHKYLKCNGAATPLTDLSSFKKKAFQVKLKFYLPNILLLNQNQNLLRIWIIPGIVPFLAGSLLSPDHTAFSCQLYNIQTPVWQHLFRQVWFSPFESHWTTRWL